MNDVDGSGSGKGPLIRAAKSSRTSDTNFATLNDDDSEWDVGIGNLIIDLDADIEKNNEANRTGSSSGSGSGTVTTTGNSVGSGGGQQMHIPRSPSSVTPGNTSGGGSLTTTLKSGSVKLSTGGGGGTAALASATSSSSASLGSGNGKSLTTPSDLSKSLSSVSMEHSAVVVEKGLKMKIKRSKPGTKSVDAKHEIVKSDVTTLTSGSNTSNSSGSGSTSTTNSGKNSSLNIPNESKLSSTHGKEKQQEKDSSSNNSTNSNNNTTSKSDDSGGGGSGNSNDQGGGGPGTKVKAPKRGSTHKKVKSGSGAGAATAGTNNNNNNSGSTPNNKKDMTISDNKSSTSSTSSTSSHVKDMIFNVSVGGISSGISAPTSAFVKTSAGSASSTKGSTTGSTSLVGHSSDIGNSTPTTTPTQGSTFRSQQQHSTSSNPSSWSGGSPAGSKGEKGQGRLSPSVTNQTASDKNNTNSPSYGKKPRVFVQPEKSSSSLEDGVTHGAISGSNSSSTYRTSVTLSSASLNDLNTSSSSILHQGVSQTGANVLSFNATKDTSKTGRVPSSSSSSSSSHDMCVGTTVGTVTEPDCLGPCEPGTSVTLEGIVWHETESGVLVVNVTWRGKTYVGTLLDCTKNDWAPPRFCDSPTSDLEMRNPKNRGKRGRAQTATPVNDPSPADARTGNAKLRNGVKGRRGSSTASAFVTPVSPLKPEPWPKRKTRGSENESQEETPTAPKNAKRPKVSSSSKDTTNTCNSKERQSSSPAPTSASITGGATADAQSGPFSPALIECPEPNCSKKYKHINGLRYHQSHAHSNNFTPEDSDSNMSTTSTTNANNLSLDAKSDGGNGNNNENVDSLLPSDTRVDVAVDMEIDSKAATTTTTTPPDGENASSTSTSTTPAGKRNTNNSSSSNSTTLPSIGKTSTENSKESTIPATIPPITSSTVSRTPILTVPVPYSSLSRPLVHGHGHLGNNNLGTMSSRSSESLVNDKSNASSLNRDDSVMKAQVVTVPSGTNSNVVSKGAPWQPHAHSHSSSHGSHTAHVISSLHSQQQQSIGNVPLTVPVIPQTGKALSKDKSDSSLLQQQQTKKQKHKKKSKEKDRERGGSRDGSSSSKTFSGQNSTGDKGKDMIDKRSSSLDESDKDGKGGDRDGAGSGENRDDPQSPAYSDISDANESGPESDLNVGGGSGGTGGVNASTAKENCVKNLPSELTNKKDSVVVGVGIPPGHSISSFFPSFYSPYNLDSTNPNSSPGSSGNNPNNSLTSKSDGSRSDESPLSSVEGGKTKGKSSSSSSSHPHMHHGHHPSHSGVPPSPLPPSSEDRRSPKVDYTLSSKYLPQHYFAHYPYTNPYHFDQPYGPSILADSSYPTNHNRVFMEEKEREIHNESRSGGGGGGGSGPLKKPGDKDESPINSMIGNIKLEPGVTDRHDKDRDRRDKDSRPIDKESQEIKGEFGENIYGDKRSSLNLLPPQHFMPCSKHSKDGKRDRDDRHSSKDTDMNKESGQNMKSGRNSVESKSSKSLNMDRDRDGNNDGDKDGKDNKNEGSKPTMETTGPPPPPTGQYAYIPQSYLQETFCHPLYRQVLVPGPYPGSPYMHPSSIPRYPPTPGSTPLPEDLSRPTGSGPPGSAKALDLLQHHAAQYYASHKIHELQERALKSPSPQVQGPPGGPGSGVGQNLSGTPNSPGGLIVPERPVRGNLERGSGNPPGTALASNKPADLTKDSKPVIIGGLPGQPSESRSPPTQHHVHSHTHHHTHVGIGYPIINHPTVPPQYSPHYGVLATPSSVTAVAASVITPYPSQKPN